MPQVELRINGPGGLRVVRGRLAWLVWRLIDKGGAVGLKVDALDRGSMEVHWGSNGQVEVRVSETIGLGA